MKGRSNRSILGPKLQRRLRKAMTDAEQHLWHVLRARQFEGCKFHRQYPCGDYVLDFVCVERMLVVEVDGGQHSGAASDAMRDRSLAGAGFEVLRFWNHDVLQQRDVVGDEIHRRLIALNRHHPRPSPPLEGEGEKLSQDEDHR